MTKSKNKCIKRPRKVKSSENPKIEYEAWPSESSQQDVNVEYIQNT